MNNFNPSQYENGKTDITFGSLSLFVQPYVCVLMVFLAVLNLHSEESAGFVFVLDQIILTTRNSMSARNIFTVYISCNHLRRNLLSLFSGIISQGLVS